ncbi:class I SAM-dependent methyltransferase [Bifidobacterium cuniculi]|nr:class I SAM-dependent methyltransferase [Bifidobacterium cuniculi]
MMVNEATREYIEAHRTQDVRDLALHARRDDPGLDLPLALDQIAGWQTARTKLPDWAACDGIVYPPHLPMEQCSSQAAAEVKMQLVRELVPERTSLVDLTGGFGVDFSYLSRLFDHAVYVERQKRLCDLAAHNLRALGLVSVQVVHADAVDYLQTMDPASMIYLDPARRDAAGARTYAIADCTPDVLALRDDLLAKAPTVLVKLSPMLDWRRTVEEFDGTVSHVVVVSVGNECKELLVVLGRVRTDDPLIVAVNDGDRLEFRLSEDRHPRILPAGELPSMQYLYEPNASIMKTGAFAALQEHMPQLAQLGANSHLFASVEAVEGFPGRAFAIEGIGTLNKKDVRRLLAGVGQANVAVRNFPLTAQQLRQRLKLKDGGETTVYGTTDAEGAHILVRCRRL